MRPYADRMIELMAGTAQAAGAVRLPLLEQRENVKTVAIVPITGDRGLAGAFNAQVLRRAFALMRDEQAAGHEVRFYGSGKKAQSTLRFRRLPLGQAWTGFSDRPTYQDAQAIAHGWPRPTSPARSTASARLQRLRLAARADGDRQRGAAGPGRRARERADEQPSSHPFDFYFEPEPRDILGRLLPVYVETELYRALLESAASEQGARMTAMRNASKSAGELIDTLTLAMNRARQAEITQEILEVVAGADALTQ